MHISTYPPLARKACFIVHVVFLWSNLWIFSFVFIMIQAELFTSQKVAVDIVYLSQLSGIRDGSWYWERDTVLHISSVSDRWYIRTDDEYDRNMSVHLVILSTGVSLKGLQRKFKNTPTMNASDVHSLLEILCSTSNIFYFRYAFIHLFDHKK